MKKWKWEGFDSEGRKTSGSLSAKSHSDVRKILQTRNIRVSKILTPSFLELDLGQWLIGQSFAQPFDRKSLVSFTKRLSILVGAGVPLLRSLEILYKQEKKVSLRDSVKNIANAVGGGKSLSEAMRQERGFDRFYCSIVKAGEVGGILDSILKRLALYLEKLEKTKAQIRSALIYPALVVFVGAAVVSFLMIFVVPQFTSILDNSGQKLPGITQLVIGISQFLQENVLLLFLLVVVALVAFSKFIRTAQGKPLWDRFAMNLPLFGSLIIKGSLAAVTQTLATLLGSGVSLIESLDTCAETISNTVISKDLRKVKKHVTEGKTLTEPLMRITYFPEMMAQMVKVGESTGKLDEMLEKVAEVFQEEVDEVINTLTKLIEPLILVVLGGAIAIILVAMYLPIFMASGAAG